MISFAGSSYSVAARAADGRLTRAGQRVEVRVGVEHLEIWRLPADSPDRAPLLLARHPRSPLRGQMIVDPQHWAELPDGHTRCTTVDTADSPDFSDVGLVAAQQIPGQPSSMSSSVMSDRSRVALEVTVVRRPLSEYDRLAGLPAPPEAITAGGESMVGAA